MSKNYSILLALHFLAIVITIIGALTKILHWHGANIWLIAGMIPEALLIGYIVFLILSDKTLGRLKLLWLFFIFTASWVTAFFYLFYKIRQRESSV